MNVIGDRPIDCDILSPWGRLSRKLERASGVVILSDRIEIMEAAIPQKDLVSPEFSEFQKSVRNCFSRTTLILNRK